MESPLETDQPFPITLANPNPSSSKTKSGPVYRVSFELTQEEWQWFMDSNTQGMVLEAEARVTHRNIEDPMGLHRPSVSRRLEAIRLCEDPKFERYARTQYPHTFSHNCHSGSDSKAKSVQFLKIVCGIEHRSELDFRTEAIERFIRLKEGYYKWLESHRGPSGTSIE